VEFSPPFVARLFLLAVRVIGLIFPLLGALFLLVWDFCPKPVTAFAGFFFRPDVPVDRFFLFFFFFPLLALSQFVDTDFVSSLLYLPVSGCVLGFVRQRFRMAGTFGAVACSSSWISCFLSLRRGRSALFHVKLPPDPMMVFFQPCLEPCWCPLGPPSYPPWLVFFFPQSGLFSIPSPD